MSWEDNVPEGVLLTTVEAVSASRWWNHRPKASMPGGPAHCLVEMLWAFEV